MDAFTAIASTAVRSLQAGSNPYEDLEPPQNNCVLSPFGCLDNFWCNPALGLADAGYGYCYVKSAYGQLAVVPTENLAWLTSHGTQAQKVGAKASMWFAFALCIVILLFYAYHSWKATTGWEEVYVCCVELIKVLLEIYHEFDSPASLYLSTGNWVLWLRYGEWLLTCPVILIHLSNITGLKDDYNKRTMRLLVSDIGCVVWGITAAMTVGYLKWIFFGLGMLYGSNTYFHAAKVYIESYHTVPKGHCRLVVKAMAFCFYAAWTMFPLLFALGPEGLNVMTGYTSTICHTVADVLSKQIWGLLGHHLRVKIYEHILIHGDIRKTTTMIVAGESVEVETFVEEEDEDTVKHSTKELAARGSMLVMRDRLQKQGLNVRASLDNVDPNEVEMALLAGEGVEPGRVILAVPEFSMVDFFRTQFGQLPAPIELVPALGIDNTLLLVQQASALGGCDFVLVHPEFLKDGSPAGLVGKLRMMGQRVCAFGWAPSGPIKDLVEARGLDGWLEGPSFGSGINLTQLTQLLARMQTMRKQAMMMGAMGMQGKHHQAGFAAPQNSMMMANGDNMAPRPSFLIQSNPSIHNTGSMVMPAASFGHAPPPSENMGMYGSASMNAAMGSSIYQQAPAPAAVNGMNPLYGSAPSPLSSQMGMGQTMSYAAPAPAPTAAPAPAPAMSEAEMLQQLMGEINKLKGELNQN